MHSLGKEFRLVLNANNITLNGISRCSEFLIASCLAINLYSVFVCTKSFHIFHKIQTFKMTIFLTH